jgi:DinB family protein
LEPPESELDDYRGRVLGARDRLRSLPALGAGATGPEDPQTGEAWDRLNVLGHVAEMLPFWVTQLRRGLRGEPYGRTEEGRRRRRAGIDARGEEKAVRLKIDRGCGRLLALLDRLDDRDLERQLTTVSGESVKVRDALEGQLVGHLEEHLAQLSDLG